MSVIVKVGKVTNSIRSLQLLSAFTRFLFVSISHASKRKLFTYTLPSARPKLLKILSQTVDVQLRALLQEFWPAHQMLVEHVVEMPMEYV